MNKKSFVVIVCMFFCMSCAHKSGPPDTSTKRNSPQESISLNNKKGVAVPAIPTDTKKLDGPTIFHKYNSAVFMIFTSDGTNKYQGSGFFINNQGLAVSNYHVFQDTYIGAETIKLFGQDEAYSVEEVIAKDEDNDFIIFRVNTTSNNYIPLAAEKPQTGEKVYAIGSPKGLENTFSSGEVSQWRETNLMQISVPIDHGSSGGALINEYGQVVGITSGGYDDTHANLNFAWSINVIKPYIK